jgi:hypothetical protein
MRRNRMLVGTLLAGLLLLAACGGSTSGNGSGTQTPGSTATTAATATATTKPKPTSLPPVTQAYCQNLMSLNEANTLMSPKSPATTLTASYDSSKNGYGVCNYMAGTALVLKIFLTGYIGPVPVPQSTLEGLLSQLASGQGVTINSATTVSGVGDQAAYLDVSSSGGGYTLLAHVFYTIDGGILFGCLTYVINGVGTNGTQSQLQQCAVQVVSRL